MTRYLPDIKKPNAGLTMTRQTLRLSERCSILYLFGMRTFFRSRRERGHGFTIPVFIE